ncbi:MAG: serine hydrolase [Reyranella sp.]|uniref:serine hydrolase n=1 Tax=Reyranella sp. TaxID=1929291 RepID=UPI001ACFED84|nr:serine hydrolase [Reyranella sp.]MBN9086279.1 serine hydrolase [Reyranella sp.]
MRLLLILALALAPALALAQAEPRGKPALQVRGQYIDQRIAEFMAKNEVPGMTMAIVQAPYIPRSAGYGRASLARDELASTRSMFAIGPMTQGFTAVATLQLQEMGKLEVRDPIDKHLAGLPAAWGRITILDLLQHASGIPDYRTAGAFKEGQHYLPAELLALVSGLPLEFQPGTQVRQSATGFALLGMIVEKASGMSYHDFVWSKQITPLGLRATQFVADFKTWAYTDRSGAPGKKQHTRFTSEVPFISPIEPATGYKAGASGLVVVDPMATANLFAFATLWSSAEDISLWDVGLAGGILVKKPENRALIYKPTTLANGTVVPAMAGWEFTMHTGFMEIKGSAPGFTAYLSRFTDAADLVCVTLLANKEKVDLTNLARDIADSYKPGLGAGVPAENIVEQESKWSLDETVARLEKLLKAQNVPIFASFDHDGNAKKAEMSLRPTRVLVFGNPKVGTRLMQAGQSAGLDLPIHVSIWQDARNRVWVGYRSIESIAAEHAVKDPETVAAMSKALESLIAKTVNVYDY